MQNKKDGKENKVTWPGFVTPCVLILHNLYEDTDDMFQIWVSD